MNKLLSNTIAPSSIAPKKIKTISPIIKNETKGFPDASIEKLFIEQLKLIYYVEKNLLKTLQKVVKKSFGVILKNCLI